MTQLKLSVAVTVAHVDPTNVTPILYMAFHRAILSDNDKSYSSSSSSSRDGLTGPLPAKCRPEAFHAHSFTTFRERGKTG